MKIKNLIKVSALPALLMASAVAFAMAKPNKASEAKATDVGEISVDEVRNAISTASALYLLPTQEYSLPDTWDIHYAGVGEEDGVFLNGVKLSGAYLCYAGTGSAHTTFYFGLGSAAIEGDIVEFKGNFAGGDYSFSMNYSTERFGDTWVNGLEDYDVVSLVDANMPNFSSGTTINTDDMGADYNYTTDAAALPMRKGFFGLTNSTGSYAFQFNYSKTSTGTGWFHVLIGGQGPLWNSGHFIDFGFLDAWATTGHALIKEMQGRGDNWNADEIQATDAIALGWTTGETNLLEMGSIKLKNSSQYFVFFKVNGVLKFGEAWTLTADAMTTKVTLQYANTDATVTNSIEPKSIKLLPSTYVAADRQLYLDMPKDICPAVNNWNDYFKSVDGNGLKLNGSNVGVSNWNYFKKTGATQMFLALGDIGITPAAGDILTVGGMFKAKKGIALYKVNFDIGNFEFDGESWHTVNLNYEAGDFAKDLLKLTLPVCSAAQDGNGSALAGLWATLGGADYYQSLLMEEKETLKLATASAVIAVPSTDAGIDSMTPEDAIAAAMYRYDYCGAKYNLTNFIDRTYSVSFGSNSINLFSNESNNIIVIISILSIASLSVLGLFVYKKKHK